MAYVLGILQILIRIHAKWWPFWKKINQAHSLYNIINNFGQSFLIFYSDLDLEREMTISTRNEKKEELFDFKSLRNLVPSIFNCLV